MNVYEYAKERYAALGIDTEAAASATAKPSNRGDQS